MSRAKPDTIAAQEDLPSSSMQFHRPYKHLAVSDKLADAVQWQIVCRVNAEANGREEKGASEREIQTLI